jgi:hypothetical protein
MATRATLATAKALGSVDAVDEEAGVAAVVTIRIQRAANNWPSTS